MAAANTNVNTKRTGQVRHHISQFFPIPDGARIDFFDANLVFDSRAFIDPFLLKNSSVPEERALFDRFGIYFRHAYDQSLEMSLSKVRQAELRTLLTFHEPKNINMGYAADSNDGHGPSLADRLLHFFMDDAAKRFVQETDAFPGAKYNPVSIEVFTTGIGPDGISDITANLIMDYLIKYTQEQAKKWGIPLIPDMKLDVDGFDFENMELKRGGYYELPENPYHEGQALILVPRRFLRGLDEIHDDAVSKVMHILREDGELSSKFSSLVRKKISDVDINDIRNVFKTDKSVHLRYLQLLEAERSKPYDFKNDPLDLFADKRYENHFKGLSLPEAKSRAEVTRLVELLISEFQKECAARDGWRDTWKKSAKGTVPQGEPVVGRKLRAMGFALFSLFKEVTFIAEHGTGNGYLDFSVVYKDYRIAIELKLLKNSSGTATDNTPAYLRGIERQLPHYIELVDADRGYYITGQHYNGAAGTKNHGSRAQEIRDALPDVVAELKKKRPSFEDLIYTNVDMSQRPPASKL